MHSAAFQLYLRQRLLCREYPTTRTSPIWHSWRKQTISPEKPVPLTGEGVSIGTLIQFPSQYLNTQKRISRPIILPYQHNSPLVRSPCFYNASMINTGICGNNSNFQYSQPPFRKTQCCRGSIAQMTFFGTWIKLRRAKRSLKDMGDKPTFWIRASWCSPMLPKKSNRQIIETWRHPGTVESILTNSRI